MPSGLPPCRRVHSRFAQVARVVVFIHKERAMKRVLSFTAYTAASAALWWFCPVHMTVFTVAVIVTLMALAWPRKGEHA